MTAREKLAIEVADYKSWREKGGTRGSETDRRRRGRISALVEDAQKERARAEAITLDDETANEIDPFQESHVHNSL